VWAQGAEWKEALYEAGIQAYAFIGKRWFTYGQIFVHEPINNHRTFCGD